jgi:transcriptional regulator with XRE-family HTH domain
MTGTGAESTGQRIARARRRRGLSQAALAGLAGRSESWLSPVERGKRSVDSHSVLTRLAMALHVPVDELTGGEPVPVRNPARGIEQAMMAYQVGPVSAVPGNGLRYLQTATSACYALYQATRYDEAGDRIAALIL